MVSLGFFKFINILSYTPFWEKCSYYLTFSFSSGKKLVKVQKCRRNGIQSERKPPLTVGISQGRVVLLGFIYLRFGSKKYGLKAMR